MSDSELRDAEVRVDIELPNAKVLAGRPIPFRAGLQLQSLLNTFVMDGEQKSFDAMWDAFTQATGITEAAVVAACPNITAGEILDLIRRFIYLLRPGRTAAQVPAGTPAATAAPAPAPSPPAAAPTPV